MPHKIIELNDLPYTVVGHTTPAPLLRLVLTGEGVKAIADQIQDGDRVTIECWTDYINKDAVAHFSEISILRQV